MTKRINNKQFKNKSALYDFTAVHAKQAGLQLQQDSAQFTFTVFIHEDETKIDPSTDSDASAQLAAGLIVEQKVASESVSAKDTKMQTVKLLTTCRH